MQSGQKRQGYKKKNVDESQESYLKTELDKEEKSRQKKKKKKNTTAEKILIRKKKNKHKRLDIFTTLPLDKEDKIV